MSSEELNQILRDKRIHREALVPVLNLSAPTLRKKLLDPSLFTIGEINALGAHIGEKALLRRFLPS